MQTFALQCATPRARSALPARCSSQRSSDARRSERQRSLRRFLSVAAVQRGAVARSVCSDRSAVRSSRCVRGRPIRVFSRGGARPPVIRRAVSTQTYPSCGHSAPRPTGVDRRWRVVPPAFERTAHNRRCSHRSDLLGARGTVVPSEVTAERRLLSTDGTPPARCDQHSSDQQRRQDLLVDRRLQRDHTG